MSIKIADISEFVTVKNACEWEAATDKTGFCMSLLGIEWTRDGTEFCQSIVLSFEAALCDLLIEMKRPPLSPIKYSHCMDIIKHAVLKSERPFKMYNLHATCRGFRAVVEDLDANEGEEKHYEIIVNVNEGTK